MSHSDAVNSLTLLVVIAVASVIGLSAACYYVVFPGFIFLVKRLPQHFFTVQHPSLFVLSLVVACLITALIIKRNFK